MAKRKKKLPVWAIITLIVIGLAAAFCLAVLIAGGVTGQTFVEVLKDWFTPEKTEKAKETAEQVETAARIFLR